MPVLPGTAQPQCAFRGLCGSAARDSLESRERTERADRPAATAIIKSSLCIGRSEVLRSMALSVGTKPRTSQHHRLEESGGDHRSGRRSALSERARLGDKPRSRFKGNTGTLVRAGLECIVMGCPRHTGHDRHADGDGSGLVGQFSAGSPSVSVVTMATTTRLQL